MAIQSTALRVIEVEVGETASRGAAVFVPRPHSRSEPPDEPSDADLIAGVRSRDHAAMAKLYDRYSRPVYSLAMTILREQRAAEDVVQDAFFTFWRRPESYVDSRGAFGPWIMRVARNRAIDLVRRRSREHYESGDEAISIFDRLVDPEPEPSDQLWSRTVADSVRGALVQLTDPQREVIELAYFRGMTQSEMSVQLGIPLGTIKTRVRTALRRLAEILDEAEVRSQWNDVP